MVIVVLAILAGVAIPKYIDYSAQAKRAAAFGVLGGVRSALAGWYTNKSLTGAPTYPTLAEVNGTGVLMQEPLPPNPYTTKTGTRADVYVAGNPPIDTAVNCGWCYDAAVGRFWLNSNTIGENAW